MSLEQKMIVSLMHALSVLNKRFRHKDISDSIRESLRPLVEDLDKTSGLYIRRLRKDKKSSSYEKLRNIRALAKAIRKAKEVDLVQDVTNFCAFVKKESSNVEIVHDIDDIVAGDSSDKEADSSPKEDTDSSDAPTDGDVSVDTKNG